MPFRVPVPPPEQSFNWREVLVQEMYRAGYSVDSLAQQMSAQGLARPSTVKRYLYGKGETSVPTFQAICRFLGIALIPERLLSPSPSSQASHGRI